MNFLYKLAASRYSEDEVSNAPLGATLGAGAAIAANTATAIPVLAGGSRVDLDKASQLRELADMDELGAAHGFKRQRGTHVWKDTTGKNRPDITFNPSYANPMNQPHMEPGMTPHAPNTIVLGATKKTRSKSTMAHEFGHALQSRKLTTYPYGLGIIGLGASAGALLGSSFLRDKEESPLHDKIDAGLAMAGTAAGAIPVGVEIDASWRGSKALGTAPTRLGRFKQRIKAFKGVPSYLTAAALPAAIYAGSRWGLNRDKPQS